MASSGNGARSLIRVRGLTKRFGSLTAVDELNLDVMPGQVFGFLGPNGAGKSTTIGMMLGLIKPTSGSVEMFGLDTERHRPETLRRLGAVIETPAFYPYMSGPENLRVLAKYSGNIRQSRVDEVLNIVGLADRTKDPVKTYSTGMKQRLGLASVLLGEPELIMLDEPTSGLDPAGAREISDLTRSMATDHGHTVFMSSHLLHEVQQICDQVAIINQGRTVLQANVDELLRQATGIQLEVDQPDRAIALLTQAGVTAKLGDDKQSVWAEVDVGRSGELNSLLVGAGLVVSGLGSRQSTLESIFLEVTDTKGTTRKGGD